MRRGLPYGIAVASVAAIIASLPLSTKLGVPGALFIGMTVVFSATGTVVAGRQPRNPIGWLFLGVAVSSSLAILSSAIADHGVEAGRPYSMLTRLAACYGSASWVPAMLPPLTFLLLLFPDGRLLGRRWRLMAWCSAAAILVMFAGTVVHPGPLEDYPQIANPLAVPGSDGLDGLGYLLGIVALVGCPASQVLRFRRAGRTEREQIKWLATAGALAVTTFVVGFLLYGLLSEGVVYSAMMLGVLSLPIAAAIAVLRYRLYDIDVVINRALVYAGLTGTLVAAYLGTVLVLQLALSPLTEQSDLAIAASTLAVAALFQPARRRIQAAVDRRFYRHRYDAARTLMAFGVRLRDEVDLDALSTELRRVVDDTMQPAHLSLWLRNA
jgi:hypothetical protein